MSIISLIIVLAVVGVLLWLINTYLPMDPVINRIINIVIIIAVVLWLLSVFGVLGGLGGVGTGRIGRLSTAPPTIEMNHLA